jgi:anthranilate phosphoribosyltransferase
MVVCGRLSKKAGGTQFLDEFSTFGDNQVAEFYQERGFHVSTFSPGQFPVLGGSVDDLVGGDRALNAEILKRVLRGEERGPKRDATLLNAAAALFVANRAKSFAEGWELASELISSGRAFRKLESLAAFR